MTDFTFRDSDTSVTSSSTTAVLDAPVGVSSGDLLLAVVERNLSAAPSSSPSGWELVPGTVARDFNNTDYFAIWYKIASGSEPSNYSWTWGVASKHSCTLYGFYGDYDTSDPFDVVSDTEYLVNDTTLRAASMSVTEVDSPIIWIGGAYNEVSLSIGTPTSPFSMTYRPLVGSTTSDLWHRLAYGVWTSNGSTGNMDGTLSSALDRKHAFALALNLPSSNGGGRQISCCGF